MVEMEIASTKSKQTWKEYQEHDKQKKMRFLSDLAIRFLPTPQGREHLGMLCAVNSHLKLCALMGSRFCNCQSWRILRVNQSLVWDYSINIVGCIWSTTQSSRKVTHPLITSFSDRRLLILYRFSLEKLIKFTFLKILINFHA